MPQDWRKNKTLPSMSEVAIARDDNNIWKKTLNESLADNAKPKHWKLQVRQIIEACHSNNHFQKASITSNNGTFSVLVNPVPIVCDENYVKGCLIVIIKGVHNLPDDLKDVLSIYCRIISNWVAKYTDCFYRQTKDISNTIELGDGKIIELYSDYSYKYRAKLPPEAIQQN